MKNQKIATICLMAAMFFNPLGFDVVQLILIQLTGSLSRANLSLYFLALSCFGLYIYYSGTNPWTELKLCVKSVYSKFTKN